MDMETCNPEKDAETHDWKQEFGRSTVKENMVLDFDGRANDQGVGETSGDWEKEVLSSSKGRETIVSTEVCDAVEVVGEDSTRFVTVVPVEEVVVIVTPRREDMGMLQRRLLMVEEKQGRGLWT